MWGVWASVACRVTRAVLEGCALADSWDAEIQSILNHSATTTGLCELWSVSLYGGQGLWTQ